MSHINRQKIMFHQHTRFILSSGISTGRPSEEAQKTHQNNHNHVSAKHLKWSHRVKSKDRHRTSRTWGTWSLQNTKLRRTAGTSGNQLCEAVPSTRTSCLLDAAGGASRGALRNNPANRWTPKGYEGRVLLSPVPVLHTPGLALADIVLVCLMKCLFMPR